MRKVMKPIGVAAGALLLTAGLTACGSDNAVKDGNSSGEVAQNDVSGSIAGAGASSQKSAVDAWLAGFQQVAPNAKVTYDPVGSGAGVTQFLQGAVAFAGTDEALTPEQVDESNKVCKDSKAFNIPVYVSPVVVGFNLPEVKELSLDPVTIAKIFKGEIKKWNDPAIAATNSGVKLPDLAIVPVHRADKSGTTDNFTDYLHAAAPDIWTYKPSKEWPISGGEAGDKTAGVVQTIKAAPGTIGYLDASQLGDLGSAKLKAGNGYIKYSQEAAAKAVDVAKQQEGRRDFDLALSLDRTPKEDGAYPLVLVSYYAVCPQYAEAKTGKLVKTYVEFVTSQKGQELAAGAAGSAPLGAGIRKQIDTALQQIK